MRETGACQSACVQWAGSGVRMRLTTMADGDRAEGAPAESEVEPLRFQRLWGEGYFEVPASERVRGLRPKGGF